jgi:alpha-glucuronidase
VSNLGDDPNWCGHDLAQANWYGFGRLAWDPDLDPPISRVNGPHEFRDGQKTRRGALVLPPRNLARYVSYTAPSAWDGWSIRVTITVRIPTVTSTDRWGTYHFADRDGVGVDRTKAQVRDTPA